ncbi:MAG TPA: cell wall biosynthesis glycosyltransferase [Candidatus Acidoferrales bacterium]|jgi:glycosyltransferase involved in cell wall biosynthesis|nr:cell wall biosynthesis glycosyltransferase [Candidatus Acidoferrales bacterium]
MTANNFLPEELQTRLKEIGEAELIVGIPSYNNARTIGHVVRAVSAGLAKYFPNRRSLIVNSDGGSKDGTRETVLQAEHDAESLMLVTTHAVNPVQRISTPYHGLPGKGSAFRTIFGIAQHLNAKACVVVDSDLRSITPHWIELLSAPVLDRSFDFIAPYYMRHKFDGTITNGIIYPITRALFGRRVRQPIGGEFGISGKLAARYLEKDVWETDVARFGVDIWLTLTAIAEGFKIGQAYLGAKLHDAKDPGADLSSMFREVVGSVFGLMETYDKFWQGTGASEPVPMFGFPFEVGVEPIAVNVERMRKAYAQAVSDLREIYVTFLTMETLDALAACTRETSDAFRMPDRLWVHTVAEFAAAYHQRKIDRAHLLQSLVPLYLGRTASFVLEVRDAGALEVEERIEQLCQVFESEKPYLAERWNLAPGKKEEAHVGTAEAGAH